ncbi:MAG: hypothetical protein M1838_004776 [Thelocarpon superellum]|nr:MAG: hypothetical protein M1838_004776 [Thelocarpon superellum]
MYAAFTPIDDVASKVASKNVVTLGLDNWKSVLTPAASSSQDPEVWWVFVTGGNKTCYGQCDKVEKAWNESAMRLATTVSAPHLARLNCDVSPVLCHAWAASPPAIWHITRPRPSGAGSKSQIHIVSLNSTSTTSSEIMDIHAAETWKKQPPYEGLFHPFDGIFAQLGVSEVVGYVLWGFAMIPSWMFMLIISIGSRTFLGGRAANPAPRAAPAPAAAT